MAKKAKPQKIFNLIKAQLLTTVSYGAMLTLIGHYQEEAQRKTEEFQNWVKHVYKARVMATLRGRPYQGVFRAENKIRPDNWNEAPLVQS